MLRFVISLILSVHMFAVSDAAANGSVLYVDAAASGRNDGSAWSDALTELSAALAVAKAGQQIWVAKGTYYPTSDNDRKKSFQLKDDVQLYGGFSGTETSIAERDWQANQTILSGNITHGDNPKANSKHVVIAANGAIIDGFVIQDGYGVGDGVSGSSHLTPREILNQRDGVGAGLLVFQTDIMVRNTVIRNNSAMKGGGVFNMTNESGNSFKGGRTPVFINVDFNNNYALARGGAMSNDLGTNPVIINSRFTNNHCDTKGGAIYNDFSASPVIVNSVFTKNTASSAAAIGNDGTSSPIIVNTKITGNIASDAGAGLFQGSYNANLVGTENAPVVIRSQIKDNISETHGVASISNWGEDWVYTYDSEIDDWRFSEQELPGKYRKILEIADRLRSQAPDDLEIDFLKYTVADHPDALGISGKQDFGINEQIQTEVEIPQRVFRVNGAVQQGGADGSSWQSAFADLRTAIVTAAQAGGGEIWVAQGTYLPTTDGNRQKSFELKKGIALYGGFAGTETELAQRDWERNPTILSGKIASDTSGNSYHVVIGAKGSILDGFIVRDGNADGQQKDGFGGGMLNWGHSASVIVRNTLFTNNHATDGGGVFNFGDVLAYFKNVKLINNSSDMGGGISARFGSSLRMEHSVIAGNEAAYRGGGAVVNYGSNAEFVDVEFTQNRTKGNGGGAFVDDQASQYGKTQPKFVRCSFSGNSAGFFGGALHNFNSATTILESNSFSGNQAQHGSDIANTLNAKVTAKGDTVDDSGIFTDTMSVFDRQK